MSNIPKWKLKIIENIRKEIENGKKLTFIHVPKCGGTSAEQYLENYNKIIFKGHKQAEKPNDGCTFAIIRDPICRFESLLNYRLGQNKPRPDFPKRIRHAYDDKSITIDWIAKELKDKEILSFCPFRTLKFWTKDVDLLITIDEFLPTLKLLGFDVKKKLPKKNVSEKKRGVLSEETKKRLQTILAEDVKIYNKWTGLD